ncbi:uncharacterized protein (DUF1800 family) [Mucilaginibacter gracilis]|uniref:Uncharacterized protein (DUF1800 family) n=1 Tax=Mucilaginibacter gracilis TaxID=423350 RepID=A0A495J4D1_9SPHI|nr:DUF1800 domain-containing protein [Mucilaginibacter gracilis]RKR83452.1 uncharacterized protein (DUF1800 family) [Mucilaginibacter gracilis]
MKALKYIGIAVAVATTGFMASSFLSGPKSTTKRFTFPYQQAGLTERQAAAHLLNRFTYGATPGQIDAVVNMGLEKWFEQQLDAKQPDDSLKQMLQQYPDLKLSNSEIAAEFPRGGAVARMAVKDGIISKDSIGNAINKKEYRTQLSEYMLKKGYKPEQELLRQFINQKILRATYTNNQLQEVLTDFWFNHFNVSITKNQCAVFIPDYERDVIRPNVLGKFDKLLIATAQSPAMLYYLDLVSSVGTNTNARPARNQFIQNSEMMMGADSTSQRAKFIKQAIKAKKTQGLNENYAREVMELHTLGVDGGYTQNDVTQAARVLTGWTVYPMDNGYANPLKKLVENRVNQPGFLRKGDFLFTPNRHEVGEKVVLGKYFGPNDGYQEGEALLEMLAHNPSTAKFITKKLAVRFVSDAPQQTLLNKMAQSFTDHDGDIREVMITMASSPEFWSKESLREKTKSPFELAISSVRSLNATIRQPYQLYVWITKMGQKMYFYQAPTGFPDKGQYWINTGALLNRMNFGLALATQRIPGITFDLAALNNHHEPESAQSALLTYSKLIIPERNLDQTIKYLTPMVNDPELITKVDAAASKTTPTTQMNMAPSNDMMNADGTAKPKKAAGNLNRLSNVDYAMQNAKGNNNMLSQVVGVIIGSPEYQRR